MKIQVEATDGYTIVSVDGRVDATNANEFEKSMMKVVEEGCTKIILDCSGLNYISSSGLRIFLIVLKKMMAIKGQFILCNLQPEIKEIFDISGLSSIFPIYTNKEAALAT
ncbi:MAG: STAS domain-containing protein [Bacteroidia bacterium]|nr:STAS domain-containing protein [Bacteroidia bacterium]